MLEVVANILGVAGAVYAVYRHFESRRAAPIRVVLACGDAVLVDMTIPRSQFSRAELLGRLGMLAKVPRLNLSALSNPDILPQIDAVVAGRSDSLAIAVAGSEKDQF